MDLIVLDYSYKVNATGVIHGKVFGIVMGEPFLLKWYCIAEQFDFLSFFLRVRTGKHRKSHYLLWRIPNKLQT